jgi:hypothetical protein
MSESVAVVVVTDEQAGGGERLHTCEVGKARVLALRHPGA